MKTSGVKEHNKLDIVNPICAGIDIHRDTANVTLLKQLADGGLKEEYREYKTTNKELHQMKEWLISNQCTVVGMESTGKYWHSVHNIFEGYIEVLLYNARHIKNIPGQKTDKSDSKWIAYVTRLHLLKSSFIPCKQIRDSRLLARTRKSIVKSSTRIRQSIHGILQSAGIKLSSNLTDLFGKSGMNLLTIIANDTFYDEDTIKGKVYGPLKNKVEILMGSMVGNIRLSHRLALRSSLDILKVLNERRIAIENHLAEQLLDSDDHISTYKRLQKIPGVSSLSALLILAETGYDLTKFTNLKSFTSWAGLCPGNNESAGKRKNGKIHKRKQHLKTLLVELAWVAVKMKSTYYSTKYQTLKYKKGPSKAIVAIAHKMCKAIYHIINNNSEYVELTSEYLQHDRIRRSRKLLKITVDALGKDRVKSLLDES